MTADMVLTVMGWWLAGSVTVSIVWAIAALTVRVWYRRQRLNPQVLADLRGRAVGTRSWL